jgi:hypothetical protein
MSTSSSGSPAIAAPAETRADWAERIRRAKEAREATLAVRSGKPAAFEAETSINGG